MAYFAFDLLFDLDVDLRPLAFSERQGDLARLYDKARRAVPCLFQHRKLSGRRAVA